MINQSLKNKIIPKDWKCALITPIYKNEGSKQTCSDYRGTSVLSPISKLYEIIQSKQIKEFFDDNTRINKHQHGFRRHFSCETALHELLNDLNLSRDNKKNCYAYIYLFSKGF